MHLEPPSVQSDRDHRLMEVLLHTWGRDGWRNEEEVLPVLYAAGRTVDTLTPQGPSS